MPTNDETAVATRVLRERLPTLTRNERCVIARYAGYAARDATERTIAESLTRIAEIIFPESEREGG